MTTQQSNQSTAMIPIPFRKNTLFLVDYEGQPYTPMRPIVEGMGLDWKSQFAKLKEGAKRYGVVFITTPSAGGPQRSLCMPIRKLFGWMMTISPNRVRADIRDTVIAYQEQCDDILWEHWSKGITKQGHGRGRHLTITNLALAEHALIKITNRRFGFGTLPGGYNMVSLNTAQVLQYLMRLSPDKPGGWITCSKRDVATGAGVSRTGGFKALRRLIEWGFIDCDTSTNSHSYRLNMPVINAALEANEQEYLQ